MSPQAIIFINQRLIIVLYILSHSIYCKKCLRHHKSRLIKITYINMAYGLMSNWKHIKIIAHYSIRLNCCKNCRDKDCIKHVYFIFNSRIKVIKDLGWCIHLTLTLKDVHFRSDKFKYYTFIIFQRTKCAKYLH